MDGDKNDRPVNLPAPGGFGKEGQGGAIEELQRARQHPTPSARSAATARAACLCKAPSTAAAAPPANMPCVTAAAPTRIRSRCRPRPEMARPPADARWPLDAQRPQPRRQGSRGRIQRYRRDRPGPLAPPRRRQDPQARRTRTTPTTRSSTRASSSSCDRQDTKTGYFGVSMYAHGLATIAMCEAYGLSQDPVLRRPAQDAHQSDRQHPARRRRLALWPLAKNRRSVGLRLADHGPQERPNVGPRRAHRHRIRKPKHSSKAMRAIHRRRLRLHPGSGSTPRMTAVGLLCRQYMENWGPSHPRMIKADQAHHQDQ